MYTCEAAEVAACNRGLVQVGLHHDDQRREGHDHERGHLEEDQSLHQRRRQGRRRGLPLRPISLLRFSLLKIA